jgi:hypothetical protein
MKSHARKIQSATKLITNMAAYKKEKKNVNKIQKRRNHEHSCHKQKKKYHAKTVQKSQKTNMKNTQTRKTKDRTIRAY